MKKVPVIILAGQSNAVGVGHSQYLSKTFSPEKVNELMAGYEDILIDYDSHNCLSNGFVPTAPGCTGLSAGSIGPELGMAEYLHAHHPGEKFYIIKWAYGGSRLWDDWASPAKDNYHADADPRVPACGQADHAGWCYNGLITLMKASLDRLAAMGLAPDFRAFCWMQGESDACPGSEHMTKAYIDNFKCLMNDFYGVYGCVLGKNCLLVDAGISETSCWAFADQLNAAKKSYAEQEGHSYLDTVAAGLTTLTEPEGAPDIAHYDAASYITLGRMFAKAALRE